MSKDPFEPIFETGSDIINRGQLSEKSIQAITGIGKPGVPRTNGKDILRIFEKVVLPGNADIRAREFAPTTP